MGAWSPGKASLRVIYHSFGGTFVEFLSLVAAGRVSEAYERHVGT